MINQEVKQQLVDLAVNYFLDNSDKISYVLLNELFSGERLLTDDYERNAEENLLRMKRETERTKADIVKSVTLIKHKKVLNFTFPGAIRSGSFLRIRRH